MSAADAWGALDDAWQEAFRQAWEALRGGNIAVGAVVTTPDGTVVSASRNRVADTDGPAGQTFGSTIAHAEINALAHVPFRQHDRVLVLTTTLQPCLQCAAAIRMAPVASVRVAGADPLWDGCHDHVSVAPWVQRRPAIPVDGPRTDEIGVFGTLISRFGLGLIPSVEQGLREAGQGAIVDLAQRLDHIALARLQVHQALEALWPDLTELSTSLVPPLLAELGLDRPHVVACARPAQVLDAPVGIDVERPPFSDAVVGSVARGPAPRAVANHPRHDRAVTPRLPRHRTGDDALDQRIVDLLDELGAEDDRDQLFEIIASSLLLAKQPPDRLDLKIVNAALQEMRAAFTVFAPYKDVPKVTIFGSARTKRDDPLYAHTRELAKGLADKGWMVVTGAGPGIMEAGMEGAGRENSIGVLIRLPFEGGANELIAGDDKLVEMRYFFTRKLMLVKESAAFVSMPGGFGTLDEMFELLTLIQTGKAQPAPLVLLDTPHGQYWRGLADWLRAQVASVGLISESDGELFRITDSVEDAIDEIECFYRNYHSLRIVGDRTVIRLHAAPTDEELARLSEQFADIVVDGRIARTKPFPPEVAGDDNVDLPRIALRFDKHGWSRLRMLIDELNRLDSAPEPGAKPPTTAEQARVDERLSKTETVP